MKKKVKIERLAKIVLGIKRGNFNKGLFPGIQ